MAGKRGADTRYRMTCNALGCPVEDWLYDQRALGKSWRQCAEELTAATGIEVSHETCRNWSVDEAVSA